MSRCNLNYLLKHHSNCLHRLISKQFNDVSIINRDHKSYIYSKNNNQIAWIWYTVRHDWAHMCVFINKKLVYEYNSIYLGVYIYDISLVNKYWFDDIHLQMFVVMPDTTAYTTFEHNNTTLVDGVRHELKIISKDCVRGIMDLYQWLLHGKEWAFLRTKMDAENIRYK